MIERNELDEYTMKWVAATLYAGGADTVSSISIVHLRHLTYSTLDRVCIYYIPSSNGSFPICSASRAA